PSFDSGTRPGRKGGPVVGAFSGDFRERDHSHSKCKATKFFQSPMVISAEFASDPLCRSIGLLRAPGRQCPSLADYVRGLRPPGRDRRRSGLVLTILSGGPCLQRSAAQRAGSKQDRRRILVASLLIPWHPWLAFGALRRWPDFCHHTVDLLDRLACV